MTRRQPTQAQKDRADAITLIVLSAILLIPVLIA